jgi:8-oxo-dGTP diphosphatase
MTKIAHDSETPAHGQQVISACALIHQTVNGVPQIFLAQRALSKKFLPGVYEIPGGHIDFGENIVDGLKREIREEFEVDVRIGDVFYAFDYANPVKGSHTIEVIYFATLTGSPSDIVLHPEDHASYKWITEDEIEDIYTATKGNDDPEMLAVRKAFALLRGESLNLAS